MPLSDSELAGLKRSMTSHAPGAAAAPAKIWRHLNVANATAAVNFVNAPPAQVAGEVSMTNGAGGSVDVYYFL